MLQNLFHEVPASVRLRSYLEEFASNCRISLPEPEIKAYPDVTYYNYFALGLSFLFIPSESSTSTEAAPSSGALSLDGVDIYNVVKDAPPSKGKTYSQFPLLPLTLTLGVPKVDSGQMDFELTGETTGQDFVRALGEPTRKGGGAGPSTGSISIWCEWSKLGIMVEFGGDEARGPQAWERGKDAIWKVVSLFPPKDS